MTRFLLLLLLAWLLTGVALILLVWQETHVDPADWSPEADAAMDQAVDMAMHRHPAGRSRWGNGQVPVEDRPEWGLL